jgi:integrase
MYSDYQRVQGLKLQAGEISKHRFVFNEATFRNYLEPFFGTMDVRKIDADKILKYKAHRVSKMGFAGNAIKRKASKPTANTINRENMVLKAILGYAYEYKFITNLPKIERVFDERKPRQDFNAREWTYMLKRFDEDIARSKQGKTATHEYRYKLMLKTLCQLLAYSGARIGGETNQSLIWNDIEVVVGKGKKQKKVEVGTNENCPYDKAQVSRVEVLIRNPKYRTKPNPRLIMAIPYLERALRAWKSETQFSSGNDFIFCHQKEGKNGLPSSVIKTFGKGFELFLRRHTTSKFKLWDDNESPHRTLYSLRHTYATQRLINGDLGVYELALNMGTSIRELERTYSKALPQAFAAKLTGV